MATLFSVRLLVKKHFRKDTPMKWSNIIVALLVALVLVAGAKRERVLIKGTTVPPGFTRKEDKCKEQCS